jgi:hypothetical protein
VTLMVVVQQRKRKITGEVISPMELTGLMG